MGHVTLNVERINVYRVLLGKPARNRLHWRLRGMWKDNIKPDLKIGSEGFDWINLAQEMGKS